MVTIRGNRPTFYHKDGNEIRAGGIIPYKYSRKRQVLEFLMIRCNGRYEDFGGCTDLVDKSIDDTILREAQEESNGVLQLDELSTGRRIYNKRAKYLLCFQRIYTRYSPKKFGNKEILDNIPRTVEWVTKDQLSAGSVHIRLQFNDFFDMLNSIYEQYHQDQ